MSYDTTMVPDVKVDIIQVMWRLLSQWKMILIVALLAAVLVSGAKYGMDSRSYSNNSQEHIENRDEDLAGNLNDAELTEMALRPLSYKDKATVMYLADMQQLILTQQRYLKESILLNANPNNQRLLTMSYYIKSDKGVDLLPLCDSYRQSLMREDVYTKIRDVIAPGADVRYIQELLSTENTGVPDSYATGMILKVRIVLTEEADATKTESIVTSTFNELSRSLNDAIGTHSIHLTDEKEVHRFASEALDKRAAISNSINSEQNNIKNYYALLTDEQKAALGVVTEVQLRGEEANSLFVTNDEEGKTPVAGNTTEDISEKPHFEPVFALIGFVLGILVYIFFYVIYIYARRRMVSARNVEFYTGSRLLGDLQGCREYTGLSMLMHSRFVDKLRNRGRGDVTSELDRIADRLKAISEHSHVSNLSLVSISDAKSEVCKKAESILKAVRARGIPAEIFVFGKDVDENELLRVQNAVSIVGDDSDTVSIFRIMQLFKEYDIKKLGCVFVEEL